MTNQVRQSLLYDASLAEHGLEPFESSGSDVEKTSSKSIRSRTRGFGKKIGTYGGVKLRIFRKVSLRVWLIVAVINIAITTIITTTIQVSKSKPMDLASMHPDDIPLSYTSLASKKDAPFVEGCQIPDTTQPRADAAFVVLVRNSELDDVIKSMNSLERHFNQWFHYPWVFLNDEPFSDEFKETVKQYTSSEIEFGLVPQKEWNFPNEVDPLEFYESIESQGDRGILYGNLVSYHKMCRFYSGYFYKHELVKKREWYWRVEPNVEFFCEITYDPFIEMEKHNKKYGFNVLNNEFYYTVPGLFRETKKYINEKNIQLGSLWKLFIHDSKYTYGKNKSKYDGLTNKQQVASEASKNMILEKFLELRNKKDSEVEDFDSEIMDKLFEGVDKKPELYEDRIDQEEYNLCHFWSNFEIARTDLFTNPVYEEYFQHLEKSGGFYKERWGDAPVHSLGVGMMLNLEDIHYFRDIGYRHTTIQHCPKNHPNQLPYVPSETFVNKLTPKQERYWLNFDTPGTAGLGCRCRCPWLAPDVEFRKPHCTKKWRELTRDSYTPRELIDVDFWEDEARKKIQINLDSGKKLGKDLGF